MLSAAPHPPFSLIRDLLRTCAASCSWLIAPAYRITVTRGGLFRTTTRQTRPCMQPKMARQQGVYAYPRRDVWVLGGTKQNGTIVNGEWTGESITAEFVSIPGIDGGPDVKVPRPVIELNNQLLHDLTGVSILDREMRATFGYRYARDLDGDGVRLDTTQTRDGRLVVHNTGHGGAGVTLSWSCALRVARSVQAWVAQSVGGASSADAKPAIARALQQHILNRLQRLDARSARADSTESK